LNLKNKTMIKRKLNFHEKEFLWQQLSELSRMMNNREHLEKDSEWIKKEYDKIAETLNRGR